MDLEFIRKNINLLGIAKRFFSEREYAELQALPESRQLQTFFECWTRKEAFIKAKGDGFSLPLRQFDVSITPGGACGAAAHGMGIPMKPRSGR